MLASTIKCPACGYDLSKTPGAICPECGGGFDRDSLLGPPHKRVAGASLAVMLPLILGMLPLELLGILWSGMGGSNRLLAVVVPYSVLLAQCGPILLCVGVLLALFQGPIYGFTLGLCWPPKRYARIWVLVLGSHALASLIALIFTH